MWFTALNCNRNAQSILLYLKIIMLMIEQYTPTFLLLLVRVSLFKFFFSVVLLNIFLLFLLTKPNKNKIKHKKCNRKQVIVVLFKKMFKVIKIARAYVTPK